MLLGAIAVVARVLPTAAPVAPAERPRRAHRRPDRRHDRRQPPAGARLPGDWEPDCAATHLDARRERRCLAGHVRPSRPATGSTRRPERRLGRELRPPRRAGRREHPAVARRRPPRQVLLRPRLALGHRQRRIRHRGRAGQLPERARLRRRLGSRLPALVAPGPRRRRHVRPRDDRAARRRATRPRSRSTRRWDENYGQGGVPGGANIPFTVPADNAKVTFTYVASTHVLTVSAGHGHDNNVEWDGLRHDSRSDVYRTPGGAVAGRNAGHAPLPDVPRRCHGRDGSRLTDLDAGGQSLVTMSIAAGDVSCYEAGARGRALRLLGASPSPNGRRRTTSGTASSSPTAATPTTTPTTRRPSTAASGSPTDDPSTRAGRSCVHVPGFKAPSWAQDAVIYQIFPDRFRNGRHEQRPEDRRHPLRRSGPRSSPGA